MGSMAPQTRYARSGGVHIAYQVVGSGPIDLVLIPGAFSHVEHQWEDPGFTRLLERLASFSRLIVFDARGAGLSDRASDLPPMEEQMDDILAVLDAAGSSAAAFLGVSQAGPMAVLFAAAHPERTTALALYAAHATTRRQDDYPWGRDEAAIAAFQTMLERDWGSGTLLEQVASSRAADTSFRDWWARHQRLTFGPGDAVKYFVMNTQIDVRPILPAIQVPTLVLQRLDDAFRDPGHARYLAAHIPGAKLVELPGVDHLPYAGDADAIVDEVQEFLTGVRPPPEHDRVLATVMFSDIVGSTDRAHLLGDEAWMALLERHRDVVRQELRTYRGREIGTTGDGFLATFDGPARAVRAARAIVDGARDLGIEVRAGVHIGEIELRSDDIGGIAVHTGARVAAAAAPSQVLVTGTVRDLVAGSGIAFDDQGEFDLKGVPGRWRLFAATTP
jgi:class 3 adenylate cyclase